MRFSPLSALLALSISLPVIAFAGPYDPVTVEPAPEDQGVIFSPGVRLVVDLPQDYVEQEFFVSGAANVYTYSDPDDPKPDAIEPLLQDVPYKTRIIVRRPADHKKFNGTLVIEWWNSTARFDTAPVWDPSAEYFAREGYAYVGVTNSDVSITHLVSGCSIFPGLLPPTCGTRYLGLSIPENGVAYEMVSQIANLLKSDSADNPIPATYRVKRIFHAGQSQQGGSMVTYASSFHFAVNDGYFVQAASSARSINSVFPTCGSASADPWPDCTPALQGADRLVRSDLPVPVYRAVTETDVIGILRADTRQQDSGEFRYYEVAGVTHLTVHTDIELIPGLLLLEDACIYPFNTLADGPVFGSHIYNAMWRNMEWQSRWGIHPPHGELIEAELDAAGVPVIARDERGNALGGIRPPGLAVPLARYEPNNLVSPVIPPGLRPLLGLACLLGGAVFPFDQETLDELYPSHGHYVSQVVHSTVGLQMDRFMLREDAKQVRVEAARSDVGKNHCGQGFEAALVLPGIVLLGRRRRTARSS